MPGRGKGNKLRGSPLHGKGNIFTVTFLGNDTTVPTNQHHYEDEDDHDEDCIDRDYFVWVRNMTVNCSTYLLICYIAAMQMLSASLLPTHLTDDERKVAMEEMRSLPEQFYTRTQLPVITPSNVKAFFYYANICKLHLIIDMVLRLFQASFGDALTTVWAICIVSNWFALRMIYHTTPMAYFHAVIDTAILQFVFSFTITRWSVITKAHKRANRIFFCCNTALPCVHVCTVIMFWNLRSWHWIELYGDCSSILIKVLHWCM